MLRILSSDILIADVIVPLAENPAMGELAVRHNLEPGGKAVLSDAQFKEFSEAAKGHSFAVVPGGSSANMLTTLSKILGREVAIRFFGVVGDGAYKEIIQKSLDDTAITLLPERSHFRQLSTQGAVSFVLVSQGGQCTIATHPGNAKEVLKPAMVAEHVVNHHDVVLAQGSLWSKMQKDFADRLYTLTVKHGKQLWLTLPTQAKLDDGDSENFLEMVSDANVVFGNEGELIRLYNAQLSTALSSLQKALIQKKGRSVEVAGREPVAFITLGKNGAVVVTPERVDTIPPKTVAANSILNTLGAGDTAYAGFAAGYIKKLPDSQSARIAMDLASEKLAISGARLADPLAILKRDLPDVAKALQSSKK